MKPFSNFSSIDNEPRLKVFLHSDVQWLVGVLEEMQDPTPFFTIRTHAENSGYEVFMIDFHESLSVKDIVKKLHLDTDAENWNVLDDLIATPSRSYVAIWKNFLKSYSRDETNAITLGDILYGQYFENYHDFPKVRHILV